MSKEILILPGDGIGQEVTSSAKEVLDYLITEYSLDFNITEMDAGGTAYDKHGSPLPDNVLAKAKKSDAILFGAVGGPKWDNLGWDDRPEQALLSLRKELELFANLRPAFLFNELASASPIKNHIIENLDILIVRELTGGIYFGEPRAIVEDETPSYAFNTMIYNEDEIKRIAKVAFEAAQKRGRKLCSVEKANVLEVSKFWRSIVTDMAKDFPDVELSHQLADNTAMQLVLNPNQFDVIVSSNLFGDILSDIAATLSGSIGMLPSASINSSSQGMYEPCHGSAPDIAGMNIANPIAMIASLGMALKYSLEQKELADKIDAAIKEFISQGYRTKDISTNDEYVKTSEVAAILIGILKMDKALNMALVGASGVVGQKILQLLEKKEIKIDNLFPLGKSTVGQAINFQNHEYIIGDLDSFDPKTANITIFSAGGSVAKKYAKKFVEAGSYVIDLSSEFRYDDDIPLIIPEINGDIIESLEEPTLIANPNCSTSQLLMVLKPIHEKYGIEFLNIATYQAVSGTGKEAVEELRSQTYESESPESKVYPKPIAFNVIPQCDIFLDNAFTKEEMKLVWETKKILDPNIDVQATCARVPVFNGHSEAVFIKMSNDASREDIIKTVQGNEGVCVMDNPETLEYPTPYEQANDSEDVYVGRIRSQNIQGDTWVSLWIVADNVYGKGAALNAVQILQKLIANNKLC